MVTREFEAIVDEFIVSAVATAEVVSKGSLDLTETDSPATTPPATATTPKVSS